MTNILQEIPYSKMEEIIAYLGGLYGLFLQIKPSLVAIEAIFSIVALSIAIVVGIHRLIDYYTEDDKFSD